jgi:hypothetical protein
MRTRDDGAEGDGQHLGELLAQDAAFEAGVDGEVRTRLKGLNCEAVKSLLLIANASSGGGHRRAPPRLCGVASSLKSFGSCR